MSRRPHRAWSAVSVYTASWCTVVLVPTLRLHLSRFCSPEPSLNNVDQPFSRTSTPARPGYYLHLAFTWRLCAIAVTLGVCLVHTPNPPTHDDEVV